MAMNLSPFPSPRVPSPPCLPQMLQRRALGVFQMDDPRSGAAAAVAGRSRGLPLAWLLATVDRDFNE